ncbi:MAG: ABC transporter substrate-binding protein, partial [Thermoanaerobaculia bacterium]
EFGKIPYKEWRNYDFSKIRVYSGPFILKEWRKQEAIYLEKNPQFYKKGYPLVEQVVFRIVPDQSSLLTQFLSYAVDMMELIPPKDVEKVKKDPNLALVTYPDRQYVYIGWNLKNPLFSNKNIRKALSMAVNTQEIINVVWHGYAKQSIGPIHSSLWAFNKNLVPLSYDPEKAKEILKNEGLKDTNGDGVLEYKGKPFEFELITNKGNAIREQTCILIQNHLSKLGIKVNLKFLEWNTMLKSLMSKNYDACLQGWRVATKIDFKEIWHTEGGYNIIGYSNPEVDKLIEELENISDIGEQKKYIDKIQELIYEDQPYTFIYENMKINGINRRVQNYKMNVLSSFYNLFEWKVD